VSGRVLEMKRPICILFVLASVPVLAGERYDHKLEEAAMRIVASKIGDIRGGFSYAQKPLFVNAHDVPFTQPHSASPAGRSQRAPAS
jgi:hypothetical protein